MGKLDEKLLAILNNNPDCYIHYHDNGEWTIYQNKEEFDRIIREEYADERELEKITLYSGSDWEGFDYASPLVIALAASQGIIVDSE